MTEPRTVGVVLESSPDAVAHIFACWQRGCVVVPLRSREDKHRIDTAKVTEVVQTTAGSGWIEGPPGGSAEGAADATAQVSFTSGTEGEAKGVVLTHGNLGDVVTRLNAVMQVTAEIREYVGIPITHSFGFGRVRAVLAAGGKAFLPARGFNPVEINTMLEAGEINAISAVPSLWRILLQTQAVTQRAGARVRWIEIGSQYMSAGEKEALRALFPRAKIVQHYGLTEASRTTFLEIDSAPKEHLESVGKPTGNVEVKISADGRVMIRGPHVATRMLRAAAAADPRDGEGWLVTNDLGEMKDGFLYYLGRADDVINCGGLKLAPDALEAQMLAALAVPAGELAVCRVPNAIRGDGILIAVTPAVLASDGALIDAAVDAALKFGVNARGATHVLRVPALPRTDNGKLKRKELAKLFAEAPVTEAPARADGDGLRAQLAAVLGAQSVRDQDTFVSLGGDSLRFIQASVVLEKTLGYVPADWEKLPFAELEALSPRARGWSQLEPAVLLRALAITSVVVNHSGLLEGRLAIDGAAFLLLIPSGYSFARFQLQRVIESGRAWLALTSLPRIVVPAVLILLVQQLRHKHIEPAPLLLVNNWVNPDTFSYWFIEVYVQLHVLLAIVLTVRWVRGQFRDRAYVASLVAVLLSAVATYVSPLIWDTTHLHNLLPQFALWYFVLGWCLLFAKQAWQKWLNTGLLALLALAQLPSYSKAVWVFAGGLILNWLPPVRLPSLVTRAISALASASLYIYVSHFLVLEPVGKKLPWAGAWGKIAVALVGGVIFWFCFEKAWQIGMKTLGKLRQRST